MLKTVIKKMLTAIERYNTCLQLGNTDAAFEALGQYLILKEVLHDEKYVVMPHTKQIGNTFTFVEINMTFKNKEEMSILESLGFEIDNNIGHYIVKN